VVNARLLDGYAERDERSLIDGREIEVRFMGMPTSRRLDNLFG
jgi:hypothetical protein